MKIKDYKIIWFVISMLVFANPISAKLTESQMCSKLSNFYNEYIKLLQTTGIASNDNYIKLIRSNCTSIYASKIEDDAKSGMGFDFICQEYGDNIDLQNSISVISDGNECKNYHVIFYAKCLQSNNVVKKLKIQLTVTIENDLISNVEDPFPAQRYSTENTPITISTSDLDGIKFQPFVDYAKGSINYYEFNETQITWYFDNGSDCSLYKYYLSETIPAKFDFSKVGKNTKGCFLIVYDTKKSKFTCYSISSFSPQSSFNVRPVTKDSESSGTIDYRIIKDLNRSEMRTSGKKGKEPIESIR